VEQAPLNWAARNAADLPSGRLVSLDALRGLDMFWIIGGEEILRAIADTMNWPALTALVYRNTEHPEWNGFSFYDLIFPLFMFIAGVAIPFSFAAHRAAGRSEAALYARVLRRGLLLVLLGLVVNGILTFNFTIGLATAADGSRHLTADFSHVRFPSVLGRIGLGYVLASLVVLNARPRNQFLAAVGILLGYWAALSWIPVPGFQTGNLLPGQNVVDFIDRNLLPGRLYKIVRDPEGLFSTVPAAATVLLGVSAGHWLRRPDTGGYAKTAGLAVGGLLALGLAWLWSGLFPFNKNLWTSSFVLLTAGWSLLLLSLFYLVVDVWRWRRWAFFFIVIGLNPITIYVLQSFVNFEEIAKVVFDEHLHKIVRTSGTLGLKWVLLFLLYRLAIFLRV
jgi:predicted acyltransferase